IDNGINFADMGGFALIKPHLNSSLPVLRRNTAFLIGAAAQSNPKVQIAAMEGGVLRDLVTSLPTEMDADAGKKYLFAIGSIVRHFPLAQKQLLELGGVDSLLAILGDKKRTAQDKKRVLALIYDMLSEREHINETDEAAKAEQYASVPIRHALIDAGVCNLLPTALKELQGLDGQQKVVELLAVLQGDCDLALRQSRPVLDDLRTRLSASLSEDADDDLLRHLVQTLDRLLGQSNGKKTEL
uniref:Nucleotide exchange factor SIL1 n=1 Tax=Plectus sambesii TaxID=2011161 RepID=A0A914XKW2_9BILA